MSDKKEYSPLEVARAILNKCNELYKSEKIEKANTAHELENGSEPSNDEAETPEQLADSGNLGEGSDENSEHKKKKKKKDSDEEYEESSEEYDEEYDEDSDEDEELSLIHI